MKEIWKDIPGFEGKYQASTFGNIRALDFNKCKHKYRSIYGQSIKMMKTRLNIRGYVTVRLTKDGINKEYKVHRLVAMTFIPNPDNLPEVNHKDRNKENNHVENLEWCTHKNNSRHAMKIAVGCFKNGQLIKRYEALNDVRYDGFSTSAVCLCCQGKQTIHKGYTWDYI